MSVNLTINGSVYPYPTLDDTGWGNEATDAIVALSANTVSDLQKVIHVSQFSGSDTNSGFSPSKAKKTIGAAMTVAAGLAPIVTTQVTVLVLDSAIYTELVTVPAYVNLVAPTATIQGTAAAAHDVLTLGNDSNAIVKSVTHSGTTLNTVKFTGAGKAYLTADLITTGTNSGILADGTNSGGEFFVNSISAQTCKVINIGTLHIKTSKATGAYDAQLNSTIYVSADSYIAFSTPGAGTVVKNLNSTSITQTVTKGNTTTVPSEDAVYSYIDAKGRLVKRLYVGTKGNYTNLKDAVDWFNANAVDDYEILLDAGHFPISDTIEVNSVNGVNLNIRGLSSSLTILEAANGLLNKAFFEITTPCDMSLLIIQGNTLATYGTHPQDRGIVYKAAVYSELQNLFIDTCYRGVEDESGADIFIFNFGIDNCLAGITVDSGAALTSYLDCEVGTFTNCVTGIELLTATNGGFFINTCFFVQSNASDVGIRYTGGAGNYVYSGICSISDCTYNNVGELISGFSFNGSTYPAQALDRDKNIVIINNPGVEAKNPHAKIKILNNISTVNPAIGTWVKVAGFISKTTLIFNAAATSGTFTYTVGSETTAPLAWNILDGDFATAISGLAGVTNVTVSNVVAQKEWLISFTTPAEGWIKQNCTLSTGGAATAVLATGSYQQKLTITDNRILYQPNNVRDMEIWVTGNVQVGTAAKAVDIAVVKNGTKDNSLMGQTTVYCAVASQSYPFSTVAYASDVKAGDYFELWVTNMTTNAVTICIADCNILVETK